MVLKQRGSKMTSEQPLKKKLRRGDDDKSADEPDFITNLEESRIPIDLQALHHSLPPNVNEDDITLNTVNLQYHGEKTVFRTSDSELEKSVSESEHNETNETPYAMDNENISITPAPDIITSNYPQSISTIVSYNPSLSLNELQNSVNTQNSVQNESSLDDFQQNLIGQCLCQISEAVLRRPFEGEQIRDVSGVRHAMLSEWSTSKVLEFLSNLQLLFDVYLKQNNKGFICRRIVDICDTIICNEYNLIEQIISLCDTRNSYINFLAAKVLSSFLIIAKTNINTEWLENILSFLTTENIDYIKMNFALDIVRRVVEWKDIEIHVLEDNDTQEGASTSTQEPHNVNCITVPFTDPESFDTSSVKGLIIKSLEAKWPELIHRIWSLISHNNSVQTQTCILTFLALWESIISVKANLSVIDTKPFYSHLKVFIGVLNNNLPSIIWKQLLSLFNEVLCYGSTLALQDTLPDDTRQLAQLIVEYVRHYRLLDSIPFRRDEGFTVNSFVGTILSLQPSQSNIDKTLLQKMVLLVLKSVAVIIKETQPDSSDSDSSVGSDDFYQEMEIIEQSIRDVLQKVDVFIKNSLEVYHPETPFSKVMVHLFSDQDDYMIESMVCTLDITVCISYRNAVFPGLINMLNPIHSFIEFLKVVSHDSGVLLDYLVSNETCFLLYLLRFLKYVKRNWLKFVSSCGEGNTSRSNELDDTMRVLILLKMQISRLVSKDLFPYNINPVLRLLEECENKYESNDYS